MNKIKWKKIIKEKEKENITIFKFYSKNKEIKNNNNNINYKRINNKKYIFNIFKYIFFPIIIFILIELYRFLIIKKNEDENFYNSPILPVTNEEYIVKKYNISHFDSSHIRYNFQELYNQRKIFKINYNYFPYKKINKSLSYNENAENIYNSTGMLNVTKLDYYYNNTDIYTLNYNHIHLSMAFDNNYIELSSISIASILNVCSPDTYIHLHILCLNFTFKDMNKIIQLKRINKNIEFVFYNAKQIEYDFGERAKSDFRGIGNYARLLAPKIVNNTNRILIIDSGDVIVQKDISEIYFYDIGDNYFAFILENVAGNYKLKSNKFFNNNFYPNGGIVLVNVRLFRKDDLYKRAFFIPLLYNKLICPVQDILLSISKYKFKFMPLIFNSNIFFFKNETMNTNVINSAIIQKTINLQKYTPYKYTIEDILEAAFDPLINHFYNYKIYDGSMDCNNITIQWIKYAKLTGFYEEIKQKYPIPFELCNYTLE